MAVAQKGDPLKKQKDSLNIKNKAVEFWTAALTELVAGIPAMAVVKPVLEKAGFRKAVRKSALKEAVGGVKMSTPTHKPKPKKPVPLPTYVPTKGVQLTPTPAPKAAKMSTPITNRLTPQSPANGKHPRKVKTSEKVTRRGRTKTTKTKY